MKTTVSMVQNIIMTRMLIGREFMISGCRQPDGQCVYIYYDDFSVELQPIDYNFIDPVVQEADVILFDIRNNPGGSGILVLEII